MFKNYIKIAFRNFRKSKLYSFINVMGLALGIACCLLIYLFVENELSYDNFHEDKDRIYRIERIDYYSVEAPGKEVPFWDTRLPEDIYRTPYLPLPLGPTVKEMYPEVETYTRLDTRDVLIRNGDRVFEERVTLADSTFFEVFTFPLMHGYPGSVLDNRQNIVLTPEMAEKYFENENPIGHPLQMRMGNEEMEFVVAGIAKPSPANSSIKFDAIIQIENRSLYTENMERWNSFNTALMVKLYPNSNTDQFVSKLNEFVEERYSENWSENRERMGLPEDAKVMEFGITPLGDIYLTAGISWPGVSNPLYSYILSGIALLVLLIACINYITLALTRSSARSKEVGVRKASGANKNQIAIQFWGETQLLTFFAMFTGLVLAELSIPLFNELAEKNLSLDYFQDAGVLAFLLLVTIITGLIAGSYPAMMLSKYNPANVLKGQNSSRFTPKLTKGLLVLQYSLSVFLIISSLIMYQQLEFVSGKDIGFNKDQVIVVPTHTGWSEEGDLLKERYKSELAGEPGIASISGMTPAFTQGSNIYGFGIGEGEYAESYIYYVDEQFIPTMEMELVAGRNFSEQYSTDKTDAIIVNEALVESLGWEDPLTEQLPWKGEENPSQVIGVVKNFHFESLESAIEPMLFHMDPSQGGTSSIFVKVEGGMIPETLERLRTAWAEVAPFTPFDYWFLDDGIDAQYTSYQKWMNIMGYATAIAIFIACMGLFGLAGLSAANRTKEIGIRKVLGAGMEQIILLFNKDILKLIVLSLLISAPVSFMIMNRWLQDFAYKIEPGFNILLISGVAALAIAIVTISYHSIKTALMNPVDSLRSE